MAAQELNERIASRGKEFFGSISGETPSVFNKGRWIGKAMEWSMSNEDFKVRLFRFVDVFPALRTGDLLRSHIDEYFAGDDTATTGIMDWGISAAGKGGAIGSALLGRAVRTAIRDLAKTFIIGETSQEAIHTVKKLRGQGFAFVVDMLGEAAVSVEEAERHIVEHVALLRALGEAQKSWRPLAGGEKRDGRLDWGSEPMIALSLKPTSVCARMKPQDFEASVGALVDSLARIYEEVIGVGGSLCLDMETYTHKNIVLEAFKRLRLRYPGYPHLGVVLQSYLADTDKDLSDLLSWTRSKGLPISIRLVKGAYWDQEIIRAKQNGWPIPVYTKKPESDAAFERHARQILENHDLCFCACASHNIRSISAVMENALELGVPEDRYEFQVLYGMAEPVRKGLLRVAGRVRLYGPFGEMVPGMAYLVRRLLESTDADSFLRQGFVEAADIDRLLGDPRLLLTPAGEQPPAVSPPKAAGAAGVFDNEPMADFTRRSDREDMVSALSSVRASLGKTYLLHIAGEDVETSKVITSVNPANPEEVVGRICQAEPRHVEEAIAAAKRAMPSWRATDPNERAQYLVRAAALMRERMWELCAWQVLEVGKQWEQAQADVAEAIDFLEFYAKEMMRLGRPARLGIAPGELNLGSYEGKGVSVVIAPWNFPMAISCGMASAAIVAGNPVVYKPSNLSPVIGHALVEIFREVGLPKGIFNYLPCSGGEVGDALVDHPDVAVIAFTGSLEVGMRINERAAKFQAGQAHIKKVLAELGGKNAVIIDDDADLDEAIPHLIYSAFAFQGQKCSACSRVIVLDGVYDRFVERLVSAAKSLRLGPAEDPKNDMGPVVDGASMARILEYVNSLDIAGRVLFRSTVPAMGFYVPVTIVGDVLPADRIAQEEIFGPVLAVMRARDFEDALDLANSTRFALTGGVFSRSPAHLTKASREFRVGNLYLNRNITGALVNRQPFGGFKLSGGGTKAGGFDYLLHFMDPRVVTENTVRRGFAPMDTEGDWIE